VRCERWIVALLLLPARFPHSPSRVRCARLSALPGVLSAATAVLNMASDGMILTNHDHQIRVGVLTGKGQNPLCHRVVYLGGETGAYFQLFASGASPSQVCVCVCLCMCVCVCACVCLRVSLLVNGDLMPFPPLCQRLIYLPTPCTIKQHSFWLISIFDVIMKFHRRL